MKWKWTPCPSLLVTSWLELEEKISLKRCGGEAEGGGMPEMVGPSPPPEAWSPQIKLESSSTSVLQEPDLPVDNEMIMLRCTETFDDEDL